MKNLSLLAMLVFAGLCQAGRPIQLEDFYRIEGASTPAISPDGRWVVFARSIIIESENQRHTELWLAPSDGSAAAVRLTDDDSNSSVPRWSPDGKVLAFNRSGRGRGGRGGGGDGDGNVWFRHMDQKGGEPFQIPGVGGSPIFSPDNRWIAYLKRTPPPAQPHEVSPLEKQLSERFKGRTYDWVNIRSDGRGYLPDPRDPQATPPLELYIVAREGGTPKQVTHLGVNVSGVAWRPDSAALALIADSHQRDEFSYERADLWVVDLQGQIRRLTDDGFEYDSPSWSPDGKNLAFRRRQSLTTIIQSRQNHGAAVDIYRMPADGGAMKNLTPDFDLIPDAPLWKGQAIWFASAVGGDTHLFRIYENSGKAVQITSGERSYAGFSFSESFDRMAYVAQDPTHPGEAYSAKTDGSGETRLSDFNGKFCEGGRSQYCGAHSLPESGRHAGGRVGSAAARRQLASSFDSQYSRRTSWSLWKPFRFRIPVASLAWLRSTVHESTWFHRLWREFSLGHLGRLGQAGLPGRNGGCRLLVVALPDRS